MDKLKGDRNQLIAREEAYWMQKSKARGLKGDENTKYLYKFSEVTKGREHYMGRDGLEWSIGKH